MIYNNEHHTAAAWPELEAWLEYLAAGNKSPRTIEAYERDCAKLLLAYPEVPFNQLSDVHILPVLSSWTPRSRHVKKAALNGWFKWGYRSRRLATNPADLLPDIRYKPNRRIVVFDSPEMALLRALPFPHGQLMTVLLETGIRRQEARFLTVRRIDFRTQEMIVKEGAKGSKERQVPLTAAAAGALHELIYTDGLEPNDHFWACHPGGTKVPQRLTPIASTTFQRWWTLCLAEAGVAYRKPHTTRHTFATFWLDERLDDGDVQMMLGHESIRTTRDIYDHRRISRVGEKMRREESNRTDAPEPAATTQVPLKR